MRYYKEEIHNYVQSHKDKIINMLKELVKIQSVRSEPEEGAPFGRACAEVLEYVNSCWQKNGFDTELHQESGYLLSYYGEGEKSIGLFSHADVVSVSDAVCRTIKVRLSFHCIAQKFLKNLIFRLIQSWLYLRVQMSCPACMGKSKIKSMNEFDRIVVIQKTSA